MDPTVALFLLWWRNNCITWIPLQGCGDADHEVGEKDMGKYSLWYTQEYHDPVSHAYELVMKPNQKELSGKFFLLEERNLWHGGDLRVWTRWIKNGCVCVLPEWQERLIAKTSIISAPIRYVRTAKKRRQCSAIDHSWTLRSTIWTTQD